MMKATRLGVTMSFLCPSNRYDLSLTETEKLKQECSLESKECYTERMINYKCVFVKHYAPTVCLPLTQRSLYDSFVWGSTSTSNIERLAKLQKRAARVILHADFSTPSLQMFETLNWSPIHKRLKYTKCATHHLLKVLRIISHPYYNTFPCDSNYCVQFMGFFM